MYELSEPGRFSVVNGVKVQHHELPDSLMTHAGEFYGYHGIEWHRQDGPNADITGTQIARGYPIATWSVDEDGGVHQYNDFRVAVWHGDSVSHYAYGIEHQGFAGTPCTDQQLDSSAALCAAIIEMTENLRGETIPLTKVPRVSVGNYTGLRGFWDHDNVDNGPLNENGHTDKLEGRSWPDQLAKIGEFLDQQPQPALPKFGGVLLKLGVDDATVVTWKRRMAAAGLFSLRDANDGPHYGPMIERATKTFQTQSGVDVDGVVGPDTW
ncbi:MAG TPA: N-acetylmuramoyl-L-alanine amidase, partial [Actinomycetota bacterium]|nr:N-acetylmuramoyl-L-alanine amidase [Actinomycetota bacterium]